MLCYNKQATPLRIPNAIIKIILLVRTVDNKILNKVCFRPRFCIIINIAISNTSVNYQPFASYLDTWFNQQDKRPHGSFFCNGIRTWEENNAVT